MPERGRRRAGGGRCHGGPARADLQLPAAGGAAAPPNPGSLLLVPYGRRLALGYLMHDAPTRPKGTKGASCATVEAVVSGPMLTPDLLGLAEEIAAYYRAPVGHRAGRHAAAGPRVARSSAAGGWRPAATCPSRCAKPPRRGEDGRRRRAAAPRAEAAAARLARPPAAERGGDSGRGRCARRTSPSAGCGSSVAAPRWPGAGSSRAGPARTARRAGRRRSGRWPSWRSSSRSIRAVCWPPRDASRRVALAELGWRTVARDPLAHRARGAPVAQRAGPRAAGGARGDPAA